MADTTYTYNITSATLSDGPSNTGTISGSFSVDYSTTSEPTVTGGSISVTTSTGDTDTFPLADLSVSAGSASSGQFTLNGKASNGDLFSLTYSGMSPTQFDNGGYQDVNKNEGSFQLNSGSSVASTNTTVCFAAGTLVRTTRGDIAVENLQLGDLLVTALGVPRPTRWLGHRTIDCRSCSRPHDVLPVRISAHAFDESRPARDLFVSPGHAICVDVLGEVLIPAIALVNGSTIQQVEVDEVTYWHVELDSHDVIFAENMPAESYLDMSNRTFFMEADVVDLNATPDVDPSLRTHADFCRPFHGRGPLVDVVKAQLARRAEAQGWSLTSALDMHLEVDGHRVDPTIRGLVARFPVPADAKDVWLVSPTARPSDTMGTGDSRDLGLCISALRIDDGFEARDIAIDNPLLHIGFHEAQPDGRRWTAGRAQLPTALWEGREGSFYLRVDLAGMPVPRWTVPAKEAVPAEHPQLAIVA